jgi:hypothetical protein
VIIKNIKAYSVLGIRQTIIWGLGNSQKTFPPQQKALSFSPEINEKF